MFISRHMTEPFHDSTYLDCVGECQACSRSSQGILHGHSKDAHSKDEDGAIEITVEGQPQVQTVGAVLCLVVQVGHEGSALNKVLVVVEGVDDLQPIQDLGD